ncbi:hypothetical protein HELRODRAFT_77422, partial [Helobdella robusta]|uniref:Cadherin domain-containing protein n=1 Tax=Helobdella robusta TaxID=6412 RepID=T1G2X4_HELRO
MKRFHLKVDKSGERINNVELRSAESLDREEQSIYRLKVIAVDGGQPARTGYANIEINVLDLNDNYPQFSDNLYILNVVENAAPKKSLFKVEATDKDADTNGLINYSFSEKTRKQYGDFFEINKITGIISQNKPLDYEKFRSISLDIIARDQGIEPLTSKSTMIINVENVNDNAPQITFYETNSDKINISLPEDVPLETHVLHFSVEDDDGDENTSCSIRLNKTKMLMPYRLKKKEFSTEFVIETISELDHETSNKHVVIIECRDAGTPPLSSTVLFNVYIKDVNDNAPKFTLDIYNISIKENNQPYKPFNFSIKATDPDDGKNGDIIYSIKSDPYAAFQIDAKSGELWTTVSLDREKNSFYKFEVVASDGGNDENNSLSRSSTAVVTVLVDDENDEPPRFRQPIYNFTIIENKQSKTELGQLTVNDLDLKSKTIFQLESNSNRMFRIDSKSGKLFSIKPLNREEKDYYTFKIIAKDEEFPEMQSVAIANVIVLDENDNPPIIEFPTSGNETVYISKNTEVGSFIAKIIASDLDAGNNSNLIYSISHNDPENHFKIDERTGELFL